MKVRCPRCKSVITLEDTMRGQRVQCEDCGQVFQVAAPSAPRPPATTPAPATKPSPPKTSPPEPTAITDAPDTVRVGQSRQRKSPEDRQPSPASREEGARRKGGRQGPSVRIDTKSQAPLIIGLAVAGGLLLLCGAGAVVMLLWSGGAKPALVADKKPIQEKEPDEEEKDVPGKKAKGVDDKAPVALGITPVVLKEDREERKVPENIADVAVGGGGRFLVLHLPKMRKLALFDVSEGKIVDYIPAADDRVLFAAGQHKLIVMLTNANVVQRWDLKTRQREVTAPTPLNGVVKSITMGSASNGPLLVYWARGTDQLAMASLSFLDPGTLKELPIQGQQQRHASFRDHIHYRASADGQVFGGWCTSHSPSGVHSLVVIGNQVKGFYEHDTRGHVLPSPDGRFLYTGTGVLSNEIKAMGGNDRNSTLPAVHGDYYLSVQFEGDRFGRLGRDQAATIRTAIHLASDSRPLVSVPNLTLAHNNEAWTGDSLTFDKRLLFVPQAKVIVTIPYTNDRIVLHRLDIDEALEKSGIDYLIVTSRPPTEMTPGATISYPIKVKSKQGGVTYNLDAGPKGMKLSADGKLTWKVPADVAGEETIVVTVKDKAGQEVFHTFKMTGPRPAQVAQREPRGFDPNGVNPKGFEPKGFDPKGIEKPIFNDEKRIEDKKDPDFLFKEAKKNPPSKDPPVIEDRKDFAEKKQAPQVVVKNWRLPPVPQRPKLQPVKLDQDKVVRSLPDTVQDVAVGGGGRFLILSLPKMQQVAIFDAKEGRVVKYLNVGGTNFKTAAGMTKLLVALTDTKVLQRWDLATFTRDIAAPLPADGVQAMALGHASEGPLLIQNATEFAGTQIFVDIKTMQKMDAGDAAKAGGFFPRGGETNVRASGDGRLFAVGGMILHVNATGYTVHGEGFHQGMPGGTPGPDGKHIFGYGIIRNAEGAKVVGDERGGHGKVFVPAATAPFYLSVPMGTFHPQIAQDKRFEAISVHCLGDQRPLLTLKDINGVFRDAFSGQRDRLAVDQRYHFIPDANLLVTLASQADKLELHRLNIDEALEKSGIDFLFVTSSSPAHALLGKEFRYDLEVKSKKGGVQLNVDSGPPGMKATGASVTWKVPADFADKEVDVILTVKDKADQELFHNFKLQVVKDLPAEPMPAVEPADAKEAKDAKVVADPKAAEKPADPKQAAKEPEPEPKVKIDTPTAPAAGAWEIRPPKLEDEVVTRQLPDSVTDVVVGGGGRFLLLNMPKVRKVALFDVNEAKIIHYFPTSEDGALIAAGMSKLILIFPASRIVQRWDLRTQKRELTTTFQRDNIQNALLGSASHGPLVLTGGAPTFVDLKTLKPLPIFAKGGRGFQDHVRVSADGTVFGTWGKFSPSGLGSLVIVGNELRDYYEHNTVGAVVPGPDGKILFTGQGLYTSDLKPIGETRRGMMMTCLPAAHGNFYLKMVNPLFMPKKIGGGEEQGGMNIHIAGDTRSLVTVPLDLGKLDLTAMRFRRDARDGLSDDKRIHLIPAAKMIASIPYTNDKLIVRRFDVQEALDKSGVDYLFVTSQPPTAVRGRDFVYQVAVKSKRGGLQFAVESGPKGMKVTNSGLVTWRVPATVAEGDHDVLMTIRDQAGQEIFHTFKLRIASATRK